MSLLGPLMRIPLRVDERLHDYELDCNGDVILIVTYYVDYSAVSPNKNPNQQGQPSSLRVFQSLASDPKCGGIINPTIEYTHDSFIYRSCNRGSSSLVFSSERYEGIAKT